jgi:hypothetical protein
MLRLDPHAHKVWAVAMRIMCHARQKSHQLAGISARERGAFVESVPVERGKIMGVLEVLITGI